MTSWGLLPAWKARALCLAEVQTALADATRDPSDDIAQTTGASGEKEPPPLAADTAPKGEERERGPTVDAEGLKLIEDAVAALETRLDRLEAVRRAEQALLDAEEACTVEDDSVDNPATWH
jgi:hypothetical protein